MKKIGFLLVFVCTCLPGGAFPRRKKAVNPHLEKLRTVFIKGNNEAAVKARENLSKWTCFGLASNPAQADATLEFSQQQSVSGAIFSANRERSIVSAELTSKDGGVLWSGSAAEDAGLINTGAGSAARYVLRHLQTDAFPFVKAGFRGLDQSACPDAAAPAPSITAGPAGGASVAPLEPSASGQPSSDVARTETKEIKLGMTTVEVGKILGPPVTKVDLGEKVLYKYKDMTVEFHNGKVTDVR